MFAEHCYTMLGINYDTSKYLLRNIALKEFYSVCVLLGAGYWCHFLSHVAETLGTEVMPICILFTHYF